MPPVPQPSANFEQRRYGGRRALGVRCLRGMWTSELWCYGREWGVLDLSKEERLLYTAFRCTALRKGYLQKLWVRDTCFMGVVSRW